MFSFMLIDPEQVRNQVNYALRLSFIDFIFFFATRTRTNTRREGNKILRIHTRIHDEIRFQMFFS
jgi:hypothetical protein